MTSDGERNIVIIGGGIVGCTTAYFLTRHPSYDPSRHKITLIEATKIAGGASGKAGGLLALWAYPSSIVPLSFRLHAELAKEHNGEERWGYRRVHVGQLSARGRHLKEKKPKNGTNGANTPASGNEDGARVSLEKRTNEAIGKLRAAGVPKDLDWFDASSIRSYDEMGDPSNTAQVHPYHFTTSMADLAASKGVNIILGGRVTDINRSDNATESVTYIETSTNSSQTLPATDVIVSAGPWSQRVFPPAPISALRAHSVTIRPSRPVSAYAIFTEIGLPANFSSRTTQDLKFRRGASEHVSPEIYARPNNEVYACGEGDTLVPLPETTADVETVDARCQDIVDHCASISDELGEGEVLVRQACYLPRVEGGVGGPLVGRTGVKGLLLAAGHWCWGIQNGPGTGKLISEFVFDGEAKSAKVGGLDPLRVL